MGGRGSGSMTFASKKVSYSKDIDFYPGELSHLESEIRTHYARRLRKFVIRGKPIQYYDLQTDYGAFKYKLYLINENDFYVMERTEIK